MSVRTHIVGLGLGGLSTAVHLAERNRKVVLYEGAGHAGGRCRSFYDNRLETRIDNGNHLLLSGNKSALNYLDILDARDELIIHERAQFAFYDYKSKERWGVDINDGMIPFWLFDKKRAIPGVSFGHYLPALKLPFVTAQACMSDVSRPGNMLYDRFWEPMTWAVLNTTPDRASAQLMWAVFKETFAKGGAACRPMIAKRGLSEAFVDPALSYLEKQQTTPRFNTSLKNLIRDENKVVGLEFSDETVTLNPDDNVVLAVPRAQAARLLPDIDVPHGDASIVNAHFKLHEPLSTDQTPSLLGLVNAHTHWIFIRDDIVSLTISAADALGIDKMSEDELLPILWREVVAGLALAPDVTYEKARLIRERRATFDQSPESVRKRPKTRTALENLFLAGDWTDTGLPATIEGSIRSGETAAKAIFS